MFYKWMRRTAKKDGYLARAGAICTLQGWEECVTLSNSALCCRLTLFIMIWKSHSVTAWVIMFTPCRWYTSFKVMCIFLKYESLEKYIVVWKTLKSPEKSRCVATMHNHTDVHLCLYEVWCIHEISVNHILNYSFMVWQMFCLIFPSL